MTHKVYVPVIAEFDVDGNITPLSLVYEDGIRYEIDRVLDVRRRPSDRCGGVGVRYICRIKGHSTFLFYEDMGVNGKPKWFVEGK